MDSHKATRRSNVARNPGWSMMTPRGTLIKIDAKVFCHARYVAVQAVEVSIPHNVFADILRMIAELRPPQVTSTA